MRDEINRVITGHLLLLQEVGCMALALGENGDQDICAGDVFAARRLHMNDGTLDNALEARGGF